jgi:hypothetical protein
MDNMVDTNISLTFTLAELPYLIPESMNIAYQLDSEQPEQLVLRPDESRRVIDVPVAAGSHRLAVSIQDRYTNQYLWVNFEEKSSLIDHNRHPDSIWSSQNRERSFHVVSKEEPLVAMVSGPAWVRVDEL